MTLEMIRLDRPTRSMRPKVRIRSARSESPDSRGYDMAVKFDLENGVAIITIDRPEARNAIDGATALAVSELIQRINSDRDIRVAILTGSGGHFCAGMDL